MDVHENRPHGSSASVKPEPHLRDVDPERNAQHDGLKARLIFQALGFLDRFLAVWIFPAMVVGVHLGNFVPETGAALRKGEFFGVSVPIAVGLLVMMYPILCKVRCESLHELLSHRAMWKQICLSAAINWFGAPFLMLALAWAFLPDKSDLRMGLILVSLGRCIAMVLIWTSLAGGDNDYCAILVAINSLLQMVLFAPLAIFLIHIISHERNAHPMSYSTVATSVAVFLGIPLGAAVLTRFVQRSTGHRIVYQVVAVLRVAAPSLVYFVVVFFATLALRRSRILGLRFTFSLAATQSLTAANNNFELAIAVAVATFGHGGDQALAATVGPLIEVPIMLGLVYVAKWMARRWDWK